MKEQIDKLIKSGNGEIKKILMSDKAFKQFCKEEFENTGMFNTVIIRDRFRYNNAEILNAGYFCQDFCGVIDLKDETDISLL